MNIIWYIDIPVLIFIACLQDSIVWEQNSAHTESNGLSHFSLCNLPDRLIKRTNELLQNAKSFVHLELFSKMLKVLPNINIRVKLHSYAGLGFCVLDIYKYIELYRI